MHSHTYTHIHTHMYAFTHAHTHTHTLPHPLCLTPRCKLQTRLSRWCFQPGGVGGTPVKGQEPKDKQSCLGPGGTADPTLEALEVSRGSEASGHEPLQRGPNPHLWCWQAGSPLSPPGKPMHERKCAGGVPVGCVRAYGMLVILKVLLVVKCPAVLD